MYHNFCMYMYAIQMIEKCPSPFSIHLLAITCISNFFCTLSRHFVGKYHYMYNQNTIHSTEHHQSIISDHRRRFTEIHGDTQTFVKLLRSGGC